MSNQSKPLVMFYYLDFHQFGGIERYILLVMQRLIERGQVQPMLVCSKNGRLMQQAQLLNLPVTGISVWGGFKNPAYRLLDLWTMCRLIQIIWIHRPAWVHVHIGGLENLLFKLLHCRILYTFHGYSTLYSVQQTKQPLKRFFKHGLRLAFVLAARLVDQFYFVSQAEYNRMCTEGYLNPKHVNAAVLYNGVDTQTLHQQVHTSDKQSIKARFAIPDNHRVVSFINRLDSNKNPMAFIHLAEALIEHSFPQSLHFIIAGDGPLSDAIKKRIEQSPIKKQFSLIGHCDDVPSLLAITDLAIFVSQEEGFGLGVLECLAAKVMCVAYTSGGIQEILACEALVLYQVPKNHFNQLVSQATTLLTLPEAEQQELKSAGFTQSQAFDLEYMVTHLEACYLE